MSNNDKSFEDLLLEEQMFSEGPTDYIAKLYTGMSDSELNDFEQRLNKLEFHDREDKMELIHDIEDSLERSRKFYYDGESFMDYMERAVVSGAPAAIAGNYLLTDKDSGFISKSFATGGSFVAGAAAGQLYSSYKKDDPESQRAIRRHMDKLKNLLQRVRAKRV